MSRILLFVAVVFCVQLCISTLPFRNTRGWIHVGKQFEDKKISLTFAMRQQNMDQLEKYLLDVSHPQSPNFGKYLTLEEVGDLTADRAATSTVMNWLQKNGVKNQDIEPTVNGEFIRVQLPVSLANTLLDAEFHLFRHPTNDAHHIVRSPSYKLPFEIAPLVDFVSGATDFPSTNVPRLPRKPVPMIESSSSSSSPFPPGFTYPTTLFNYYQIANPFVEDTKASQSVFETLDQSYSPSDLTTFQQIMNVTVQAMSKVIGPNQPGSCANNPNNCAEASLDVQYIMAVAQKSPTVFWSIASSDQQPYLDFAIALANDANPPLVHSISYGDVELYDDPVLMNRFNDEVMKLGTRGLTVMVASGDDGVANFPARGNASNCGFYPAFPASAPYVVAVGATQGPENNTAEVACTSSTGGGITTGGGFSNVFPQPSYQTKAVANFLSTSSSLPPLSMFNSTSRGYPDVAIMGHNYIVADGGQFTAGSGTSASAPVFAAMVTLANSARIAQGKSSLGFLNQILYNLAETTPSVFNDITSGENNCAAGDVGSATCCQYGFTAVPGWDATSGLGSVNFANFLQAVIDL